MNKFVLLVALAAITAAAPVNAADAPDNFSVTSAVSGPSGSSNCHAFSFSWKGRRFTATSCDAGKFAAKLDWQRKGRLVRRAPRK